MNRIVPIPKRRRDLRDESAETRGVERPHLSLDGGAGAFADPQQSGFGRRRAGQCEKPVIRRRFHFAREGRAEFEEFAIEGQAREMRPDDRDLDAVTWHATMLLAVETWTAPVRLDRRGNASDETVGASGRDQGHTRGQPVTANARWNSDRAQVEQVDEVGIGPKPGIETNGIGLDLGDGVEARRCRNEHRVEFGPDAASSSAFDREPIKSLERGDSVELARALDNRTGDWKQRFRIALDQRLRRGVSLGDPWTFVERLRDFGEWLEVELDDPGAERCGELNVARERVRGVGVIEELPLIRAGNAQPKPARERRKGRVEGTSGCKRRFRRKRRPPERP